MSPAHQVLLSILKLIDVWYQKQHLQLQLRLSQPRLVHVLPANCSSMATNALPATYPTSGATIPRNAFLVPLATTMILVSRNAPYVQQAMPMTMPNLLALPHPHPHLPLQVLQQQQRPQLQPQQNHQMNAVL